jgi:hypothetical protein
MRTLPEITLTIARDRAEHSAILERLRSGEVDDASTARLGELERDLHAFDAMCLRTSVPSPIALGYRWGETLVPECAPDDPHIVRERGLLEHGGEMITLPVAAARLAARGLRASLGGWTGSAGRLGDLARMSHPSPTTMADAEIAPEETEEEKKGSPKAVPNVAQPPADKPLGTNYDLFG